ncbi:MAG: sensor histidine kinase [Oligoflexales bacterium]
MNILICAGSWLLGRDSNVYIYHYTTILVIFIIFEPEDKFSFFWEFIPSLLGLLITFFFLPGEPSALFSSLYHGPNLVLTTVGNFHVILNAFLLWGLGFIILGILETYHNRIIRADEVHLENSRMAALKVMSSGIAHEVNNPLAIISSRARQLQIFVERGDFGLNEKESNSLLKVSQNIELHVQRIAKIVSGLRSFSVDEKSSEQQEYSIKKVIEQCIILTNEQIHKYNIDLRFDIEHDFNILCKPSQLMQVFLNLFSNSIDAIKELKERWIKITIVKESNSIEITITDSGTGIPDDLQSKVMQPFFTTKEVGKGTGLGLSVALGIVKHHNGKLYINRKSENTSFVVELPSYKGASFSNIA